MDAKKSWLVALAMFAGSMLLTAAVGLFIVARRNGPVTLEVPAAVPILVGAVALAGSSAIAKVAAVPHNSAQRFRTLAFLSTAVLDAAVLAGVVLTLLTWRTWPTLLLAGIGLLGIAAFVLPATNAWFRAQEDRATERDPLAPS